MSFSCRACGGDFLPVLELGPLYLSDFRADDSRPPAYPLNLVRCASCSLVQLDTTTPRELLYTESYGYRSGVSETVRTDLAGIVARVLLHEPERGRWLDIACNDGTLLSYVPETFERHGIDPVEKLCVEAEEHGQVICGYFPDLVPERQFEVITSISVFYDLDDPGAFVEAVARSLAPNGIWAVQQNYLLSMFASEGLDNICHEHLTYFSLKPFERLLAEHGLEVFAAWESEVNGGCFGCLVGHRERHGVESSVGVLRNREARLPDSVYADFARKALRRADRLGGFLLGLYERDASVYLYGASTRSQTLWQVAGVNPVLAPACVERNPDKVGRYVSSLGVPIISEEQARRFPPDYLLVGPWYFRDEFLARERSYLEGGGAFIFPLPELEVVGETRDGFLVGNRHLLPDSRQAQKHRAAVA